jgi:hypothetical protein
MDGRKILLIDLSKGKVGEDNAALLGAMIITKLQLAALSRVDVPETERKDFFLYVDEFQNFVTDSFATILSEARKYRLNLTIGHQYIGQLTPDHGNTRVRDAVFGNVGTMVCFRVGAADAEYLETEFEPAFTPNDIVNLPKYNVILKLMINGVSSDPFTASTMPINEKHRSGNAEKVIRVSRERYGNAVAEVEEKISRWMGAEFHEQSAVMIGEEGEELTPAAVEQAAPKALSLESLVGTRETSDEAPKVEPPKPKVEKIIDQEPAPAKPAPVEMPKSEPVSKPVVATFSPPPKPQPQQSSYQPANSNGPQRRNDKSYAPSNRPPRKPFGHSGPRKVVKPAPKRDNPIWDTVSKVREEKLEEIFSVKKDLENEPRPKIEQKPEQAPVQQPITENVKPANDTAQAKEVLQPGQVQKF